jgi:hypothetical protein
VTTLKMTHIADSVPPPQTHHQDPNSKITFIPHAPKNLTLPERLAWRAGYRAALKLLAGNPNDPNLNTGTANPTEPGQSPGSIYWCATHRSTSPDTDRCDFARYLPPDQTRAEREQCKLSPAAVVTAALETKPWRQPQKEPLKGTPTP